VLCADEADAERATAEANQHYPHNAPHTAVQLAPVAPEAIGQAGNVAADARRLLDPTVVHAAMLRGQIATPTVRTILHIQGNGALEAHEAMERDAERYRLLRRGQHWSVIDGIGDTLRAEQLDAAIDRAMGAEGATQVAASPSESSP
jgi:hypothetical protein